MSNIQQYSSSIMLSEYNRDTASGTKGEKLFLSLLTDGERLVTAIGWPQRWRTRAGEMV